MENEHLEKRIDELEQRIAFLENQLAPQTPHKAKSGFMVHQQVSKSNATQTVKAPKQTKPTFWQQSDFWLNKVGVTLLLISIAYFFSYSIEQGWLTEVFRLYIGILSGFILIGLSYIVRDDRIHMPDLLKGAGLGIFYLTLYASYQWYAIVPQSIAVVLTIIITLTAFVLAWFHKREYVGIFAVVGGYISPILLSSEHPNIVGFTVFVSVIAVASSLTSINLNWKKMGLFTIFFGWGLMFFGQMNLFKDVETTLFQQLSTSALLLVFLLATGPIKLLKKQAGTWIEWDYLFVLTPLLFLAQIYRIFDLTHTITGLLGASIAAILFLSYLFTKEPNQRASFISSGALIGAASFSLYFDNDVSFVFPAIFGAISLLIHSQKKELFIVVDWLLMMIGLLGSAYVLQNSYATITPFLSFESFLFLCMFVMLGITLSQFKNAVYTNIAGLFAHYVFMYWISVEFESLDLALLFTTSVWVFYAVYLLIYSVRNHKDNLKKLAITTLAFIILKIFLYDLNNLDFFWRFILLAGVGGFLMVISYAYKKLVKETE
ncbi:DUF2339 domain-containing protein [bacterium]|nr:MAG: DUF2339 domain-containing protein [bacterium]